MATAQLQHHFFQLRLAFNGTDFHTGIDITGSNCMGATIVAANTGTVVKANTTLQ